MIYFVETNKASAKPSDLASFGLAHIRGEGESLSVKAASGKTPGGNPGLLLCNRTRFGTDGLRLDLDWSHPLPGLPAVVRVAWTKRPGPEELARDQQLSGYRLTDAADRKWLVPVVRRVGDDDGPVSALPCYLTIGPDGNMIRGEPKAEYRHIWEASAEPWNALLASVNYERALAEAIKAGEGVDELGPPPELTDADVMRWLTPILAANYVIGGPELVQLGAFDELGVQPLSWLSAALSIAELLRRLDEREEQKKTDGGTSPPDASGSIISSGEAA